MNSQLSYCRSPQTSRFAERGQTVKRLFFEFGQTNHPYIEALHVGNPATPTNSGFLKFPLGVNGRIISFGLSPLVDLAGANADGTVLLRVMPYTPGGGAAFATIGTITLGATAAGYMVAGGVEERLDGIALAGAIAPYAFTGGEFLCAYLSAARTGAGAAGLFKPWIEVIYDDVDGPPTAAALALVDTA
jgi:hypothetical protein